MLEETQKQWLFVGGYGNTIETFDFDPLTGALTSVRLTEGVPESPTFLALDEPRKLLFAISEKAGADAPEPGRATSFSVDSGSGKLTKLNEVWAGGGNTVSVVPSRTGKTLLTASSSTAEGRVAVIPVADSGELAEPSDSQVAGKNAHGLVQSVDGQFVWVVCRGDELVAQYRLDEGTGKLQALSVPSVSLPKPSGPRRMAVHPSLKVAYVLLDWAGKIVSYSFGADGQLKDPTTISVFPAGKEPQAVTGVMTAAELEVSADGKTVYASTRTADCQSIAILKVDSSGRLTLVANEEANGLIKGPRHFMLSRDNRHMIVANQDNDTLLVLAVNATDGSLSLLGTATPTRVKQPNAVALGALSAERLPASR
jgi:6-phosphogluconolactonase